MLSKKNRKLDRRMRGNRFMKERLDEITYVSSNLTNVLGSNSALGMQQS